MSIKCKACRKVPGPAKQKRSVKRATIGVTIALPVILTSVAFGDQSPGIVKLMFMVYATLAGGILLVLMRTTNYMIDYRVQLDVTRLTFTRELKRREDAWEADRSELIATACEVAMMQLKRDMQSAQEEGPRNHLRIVDSPEVSEEPPEEEEGRAG